MEKFWQNILLLKKLISKLCSVGDLRVASIKHAHHDFDIDQPGYR